MKLLKFAALAAVVLAGGCATNEYGARWQRTDGRAIDRSFDWAMSHCRRRASDQDEGRDAVHAMRRCMERRGYVWTTGYYD
jgi:hypothetical protein